MKYVKSIDGTKTYIFCTALAVLGVCELLGLVEADLKDALFHELLAAIAASLRHKLSKLPADSVARWQRVSELMQSISRSLPQPVNGHKPDTHPRDIAGSACLLLLLWPCVALASDDIRIAGPSGVPVAGFPCELHIQGKLPEGTKITWDYFPRYEGVPLVEPLKGGRVARLNTLPGVYKIIASITPPGDAPGVIRYKDFSVPGSQYVPDPPPIPTPQPSPGPVPQPTPPAPNPAPTPQPIPPVNPDPVFPPGQFQLAEATYRLAVNVPSANRRGEITCLSSKVVALINGLRDAQDKKTPLSPQVIVQSIAGAFDQCLPSPAWDDCRNRFTDLVAKLYQGGQLRTNADWQTLAEEALQGLNAAAVR